MWTEIEKDRHYGGAFQLGDEFVPGEILYNKKKGVILLVLKIKVDENNFLGRNYSSYETITGELYSSETVTLLNCRCVMNKEYIGQYYEVRFSCKYMIWSHEKKEELKFNQLVCTLDNALTWSQLSPFKSTDKDVLEVAENFEKKRYNWYGCKISFMPIIKKWTPFPVEEDVTIAQRLQLTIETDAKQSMSYLLEIRNMIIALISFAIKDNVNVEDQSFYDNEDVYTLNKDTDLPREYYCFVAEPYLSKFNVPSLHYNFFLDDLGNPSIENLNAVLLKLAPVTNLYLSLFKYDYMSAEMVFLNIVQAIETFHARFYYDNAKGYIKSVENRYDTKDKYYHMLLSENQKGRSGIHLKNRLVDLIVRSGVSTHFCSKGENDRGFPRAVINTRNYFTHYDEKKKDKALQGDDLKEAILILRLLLEYHVCNLLGTDKKSIALRELEKHEIWMTLEY